MTKKMAKATHTVFCGGNGCMFLKGGLAKRQAEREATGHRCLNPDAHVQQDMPKAPAPVVPYVDVCHETAYGQTTRLPFMVRVF